MYYSGLFGTNDYSAKITSLFVVVTARRVTVIAMASAAVTYVAMVTAVENDDVKTLKHLLQTGADVNANLDDDIGISCHV